MKLESYYINIDHRVDRRNLMEKNWNDLVTLNRVSATVFPEEKFGTKACYASHEKVLKLISMTDEYLEPCIIMEDDVIPSKSFSDRLEVVLNEIPKDWDILLLGHSTTERSKFKKVTNNICRAQEHVLSGTCYIVNPNFYQMMLEEYKKVAYESNLDALLMVAQVRYNVYAAIPSLCYQYESFSDNSKMVVGNTHFTQTYFKD